MAKKGTICELNNVQYIDIRMAMVKGLRTLEEIKADTNVCGECAGCKENLDWILSSVCGCKNVSLATVVNAVKNGANTVEKVAELTQAGTDCGRCTKLVENIIAIGR
ncbi:MAG: (2Fe-2S)-binding protein [Defluviitaleaceae bacterium]|nr:(2Fe-2S)-binding protein [Defluviitaleaceae bacterium]